ncbi:MAG: MaoC family dehydratase [Betaproteobacteria bacterium]|nr:MaoC family dehydratase [Betaproteobacteria bacterium]
MKFADFYPGQVIHAGPYRVGEDEIISFARAYDRQWFHTDAQAAAEGPFGGLIASGWHTCAIAMSLVSDTALHQSESYASPGIEQIHWPHPVRPGDELSLTATILDVRRSATKPDLGILRWHWQLHNQNAAEVLDLVATSLFDMKQAKRLHLQ